MLDYTIYPLRRTRSILCNFICFVQEENLGKGKVSVLSKVLHQQKDKLDRVKVNKAVKNRELADFGSSLTPPTCRKHFQLKQHLHKDYL